MSLLGDNNTLINHGTIQGSSRGVFVNQQTTPSGSVSIVNYGVIQGETMAVEVFVGGSTLENHGTVQGNTRSFFGDGGQIDPLIGGGNNDILNGGAGNDALSGFTGDDTFVFENGFGTDTISDFNAASAFEQIDLSAVSNIVSFADLQANHLSSNGMGHAVITDGSNSVTLTGVAAGTLTAGDFDFV